MSGLIIKGHFYFQWCYSYNKLL